MLTLTTYQKEIIGTGLKYPDSFNPDSGQSEFNSGTDRINQSIYHILSTRIGTRFFLPEFGSRLYELIFEPNDDVLADLLILYIKDALQNWEPRINKISVNPRVYEHDNTVPVYIKYCLINTNIVGNYIYPFQREIYPITGS